jgi:hypothetical protein
MQRQTWSGIIVAAVFAVSGVVMAQSPASQPAPQEPSASPSPTAQAPSQAPSANRVTVTGCLREASPATATSGSGAPAATDAKGNAPEPKYILADAAPSSSNASGGAAASAQTYRLIANDSALAPHVGKKLEFTGTVEGKEPSASGESRLQVESARVISADCSK